MKKIIIINIKSLGLGNLFFQLGAATTLAKIKKAELFYDLSNAIGYELHTKLEKKIIKKKFKNIIKLYNIKCQEAKKKDKRIISGFFEKKNFMLKILNRIIIFLKLNPTSYYREIKDYYYDNNFLKLNTPVYLDGYFINPKYFHKFNYLPRINKINYLKNSKINYIINKIKKNQSVSLHIRRGDYLLNKDTYPIYGKEYIDRAIKILKNKVSNLKFFIFTNDIIWTEKNFNVEEKNFFIVSKYTKEPWEDLELMSLCKHNIISNSTFSWWAAYKNNYRKKTIIAPKKWINDNNQHFNDLFMKDWISI
jgi:hypothetical protein